MKVKMFFKDAKPGTQVAAVLLIQLSFFVLALVVQAVFTLLNNSTNVSGGVMLMGQVLVFACPALLWAVLYNESVTEVLRLRFTGKYWLLALGGMLCFALLTPFIDALTNWNAEWSFPVALHPLEEAL
ncbi:MAG: hypothetical protein SPJ13_03510, partial [Bacteroidales bacterium]|nr:hypothetical protein [Bacteroidales bacterium]